MTNTPRHEALYNVPRDAIRLRGTDPRLLALADRLWERAPAGADINRRVPPALSFAITIMPEGGLRSREPLTERWTVGANEAELSIRNALQLHMDLSGMSVLGRVSGDLLADEPALVARLLLETPASVMLSRRGYAVLHAGAVMGPRGAVVIRGAAGGGKSTLIGAAYRAGISVLGDETILVSRSEPDELLAAVRDLTLLPDATRLLGLESEVTPAGTAHEPKHRIDLFHDSTPAMRRAHRIATVLLGPWQHAPARLERLTPNAFLHHFRDGAISQERWSGTPPEIADHWARRAGGIYRLVGAEDLDGAIEVLHGLVTLPAAVGRA